MARQLFLLALLVGLALAQSFDLSAGKVGTTISLASNSDLTSNGTVNDYVLGCDYKDHTVQSVVSDGNAAPTTNYGNSLSILIANHGDSGAPELSVQLLFQEADGSEEYIFIEKRVRTDPTVGGWTTAGGSSTIATCANGATCNIDYYCSSQLLVPGTYVVRVYTSAPTSSTPINNYTLTVTQWREPITIINTPLSIVTFQEATAAVRYNNPSASVVGPRKWRHYYADLTRPLAERGFYGEVTLRVDNFRDSTGLAITGSMTAQLCYQVGDVVGRESSSDSCFAACTAAFTLTSNTTFAELVLPGCLSGPIFIGVKTPSNGVAATQRLSFLYNNTRTLPIKSVTPTSYATFDYVYHSSSATFAPCDPREGGFSCENHYQFTAPSSGTFDGKLGPWLIANVHSVVDGTVGYGLSNNNNFPTAGTPTRSACEAPVCSGTVGTDASGDVFTPSFCVIKPCSGVWNSDSNYDNIFLMTVYGTSVQYTTERNVGYELDIDVATFPLTTVSTPGVITEVGLKEYYYRHYQYAFAAGSFQATTQFIVEFYANKGQIDAAIYWNFGSLAGHTDDCYDNQGSCRTANADNQDAGGAFCRFQFVNCDDPYYEKGQNRDRELLDGSKYLPELETLGSGLVVSSLRVGTYYFAVKGLRTAGNAVESENKDYLNTVDYTLTFTLREEKALAFGETYLQTLFPLEFSQHYYVDMPTDAFTEGVSIYISDTAGTLQEYGNLDIYAECNFPAGGCPCFTNSFADKTYDAQFATEYDDVLQLGYSEVRIKVPRCNCPSGRVYISLESRVYSWPDNSVGPAFGADDLARSYQPIGYTVTVLADRASATSTPFGVFGSVFIFDADHIVVPGRYPERSVTIGSIAVDGLYTSEYYAYSPQCTDCTNYRFYAIDTSAATSADALLTRIAYAPVAPFPYDEDDINFRYPGASFVVMYVTSGLRTVVTSQSCGTQSSQLVGSFQFCTTTSNQLVPGITLSSFGNVDNFADDAVDDLRGVHSSCQLVFEPCTQSSTSSVLDGSSNCYDSVLSQVRGPSFSRRFDTTERWYIAVQNAGTQRLADLVYIGAFQSQPIQYTLLVALKDQSVATQLTDGVPVKQQAEESTYQHYRVAAPASSADALTSLQFEAYTDSNSQSQIVFYYNRGTLAGNALDCYSSVPSDESSRCGRFCQIYPLDYTFASTDAQVSNAYCWNQLRPCELASSQGDIYFSAYQRTLVSLFSQQDFVYDSFYTQFQAQWFDRPSDFTIRVTAVQPVELLGSGSQAGWPVTTHLHPLYNNRAEMAFYTLTPATQTGPYRLKLRVTALSAHINSLFITVSDAAPSTDCTCQRTGWPLARGSSTVDAELSWSRDWCQLKDISNPKYYVTIDFSQFSNNDVSTYLPEATFTIVATLQPIEVVTPALTLVGASTGNNPNFASPVFQRYSSDSSNNVTGQVSPVPSPVGPFRLNWAHYKAFSFTPSFTAGRQVNVRVWQGDTTSSVRVVLTAGFPIGEPSVNDIRTATTSSLLGSLVTCDTLASCAAANYGGSTYCNMAVAPCAFSAVSGTFYVTVSADVVGFSIDSYTWLHVAVALVDPLTVLQVPSGYGSLGAGVTNSGNFSYILSAPTSAQLLEQNNRNRYYATAGSFGLNQGERVRFTYAGATAASFRVYYGNANNYCDAQCETTGQNCEFVVCNPLPSAVWYVALEGLTGSITSFTIQRELATSNTTTGLSATTITQIRPGQAGQSFGPLTDRQYSWHTVSYTPSGNEDEFYRLSVTNTGGSVTFYQAAAPVYWPAAATEYPAQSYTVGLNADGTAFDYDSEFCGASTLALPLGSQCCVAPLQLTFAVRASGTVSNYTVSFVVQPLSTTTPLASGATQTVGLAAATPVPFIPQSNHHSYTVSTGAYGFYYTVVQSNTTSGQTISVNFNVNQKAGASTSSCASAPSSDVPSSANNCHGNVNSGGLQISSCGSISASSTSCHGYIRIGCVSCLQAGDTLYFSVSSSASVPVSYVITLVEDTSDYAPAGAGSFPGLSLPLEDSVASGANALYRHYIVTASVARSSLTAFYPQLFVSTSSPTVPTIATNEQYRFEIIMSGLSDQNGVLPTTRYGEITTYLDAAGGCGAGTAISGSLCTMSFISNANDVTFNNATVRTCGLPVLPLLCGGSQYIFTVARSAGTQVNLTYSFQLQTRLYVNDSARIVRDHNVQQSAATLTTATTPGTEFGAVQFTSSLVSQTLTNSATAQTTEAWLPVDVTSLQLTNWVLARFKWNTTGVTVSNILPFADYAQDTQILRGSRSSGALSAYTSCTSSEQHVVGNFTYCELQFDPAEFYHYFAQSGGSKRFWLKVITTATNNAWSINYRLEALAPTVLNTDSGATSTLLVPESGMLFAKEIYDLQWQFYDFFVPQNTGYLYDLTVSVQQLDCFGAQPLQIYASWVGGASSVDTYVPSRWPAWTTWAAQADGSLTLSSGTANCFVYGGHYRVGVYAPIGAQLFPITAPIRTPVTGELVLRPVQYLVSAVLDQWPHRTIALECHDTQSINSDTVYRYEVNINGENRGSELSVTVGVYYPDTNILKGTLAHIGQNGAAGSVTLSVSSNANPYSGNAACAWGPEDSNSARVPYDYRCTSTTGSDDAIQCTVTVPPQEFRDGRLFLFVSQSVSFSGTGDLQLKVTPSLVRKYIPLLPVTETSKSWVGVVGATGYQYYKVVVDTTSPLATFLARLYAQSCDSSVCDLSMTVARGHIGYSTVTAPRDATNVYAVGGCNLNLADSTLNADGTVEAGLTTGTECTPHSYYSIASPVLPFATSLTPSDFVADLVDGVERNPSGVYFIGVAPTVATGVQCAYSLDVVTQYSVEPLVSDLAICDSTLCQEEYELVLPLGSTWQQYSSVSISLQSQNTQQFRVLYAWDYVPYWYNLDNVLSRNLNYFEATMTPFERSAASNTGSSIAFSFEPPCNAARLFVTVQNIDGNVAFCDYDCDSSSYSSYSLSWSATLDSTVVSTGNTGAVVSFQTSTASLVTGVLASARRSTLRTSCTSCSAPVILGGAATTYFGYGADAFSLSPLASLTVNTPTTVTFDRTSGSYFAFAFTLDSTLAGASISLQADAVTSGCGIADTVYYAFSAADQDLCGGCPTSALFSGVSCGSAGAVSLGCLDAGSYYVVLSTCGATTCPLSFRFTVDATPVVGALIGGTHDVSANRFIEVSNVYGDADCLLASTSSSYFVDVTDILAVHVTQPFGNAPQQSSVPVAHTVTVSPLCGSGVSRSVHSDFAGSLLTERVPRLSQLSSSVRTSLFSCVAPGRYRVSVSANLANDRNYDNSVVSIQAVNAWLSLGSGSSRPDALQGEARHFYSVSTQATALSIDVNIAQGPALEVSVFEGCTKAYSWQSFRVCAAGSCRVDIPTRALHSGGDVFYVVLTGAQLTGTATSGSVTQLARNINVQNNKPTLYTITATVGTANCVARPSTGFCAGAFDDSASTWSYANLTLKDDEARCRYERLIDRCPAPTSLCKEWLRIFSCLESFPACDASGFVQGTCQQVCQRVECVCGTWLSSLPGSEFQCLSDRYVDGAAGTCHAVPTPTPTPTPVSTVIVPVPTDECHLWVATLDDIVIFGLRNPSTAGTKKREVERSACTEAEITALAQRILGPTFDVTQQFSIIDRNDNTFSVQIIGNTIETCTSASVRFSNGVYARPDFIQSSCLASAVVGLQEPETLIPFIPESPVIPPDVVGPPGPAGPAGPPGPPGLPAGVTPTGTPRPDVSVSAASSLNAALMFVLVAFLAFLIQQ